MGPGNYELSFGNLGTNKRGVSWNVQKNLKKGVTSTENKIMEPGPGSYNVDKVDIFPIYKYKPSSIFVSKVQRETAGKDQKLAGAA